MLTVVRPTMTGFGFLCRAMVVILATSPFLLAGLPGPASGGDPLATLRPGHPRLLATAAEFAALPARAAQDPLLAATLARVRQEADFFLGAPVMKRPLTGPLLLDQSLKAQNHILICALAFRITGDHRYRDRAVKEMIAAAAFPDWNPTDFLNVAEMATALALGYDWLYPDLTDRERNTIRRALREKALVFAPAAYAPGGPTDGRLWFTTTSHNWNQVCNGGLLAAALALADEEPELARTVIAGVRQSLPRAIAAYKPDGALPEGPSFGEYGTAYQVLDVAMLDSALGSCFGLDESPAFRRTAFYRLAVQSPTGLAFNYGDGDPELDVSPAYIWLAHHFGPPAAVVHSRALLALAAARKAGASGGDRFFALHALWLPPEPAVPIPAPDLPLDFHFRGPVDLAIFRSAWGDPRALFVGFKAGDNSAIHGHLDLGSFVLDADDVRWAVDLGSDNYNLPGYHSVRRWTYFRLNNLSHNTLTPGDALQGPKAIAPIIAFGSRPDRAFAVADLTPAYPGAARKIIRGVALLDRARVLVQDDVTGLQSGLRLRWRLITSSKVLLSGDGRTATLEQKGRTLRVEILAPSDGARFSVGSTRPPTGDENQNRGTVMLAIEATPTTADVSLAVLLTPVGDHWPAGLARPEIQSAKEWK